MKALLLIVSAFLMSSAFAAPNVPETGEWDIRCLVFTTGPSGADVKTLAHGKHHIVMQTPTTPLVLYKEGDLEFRTWVSHFAPEGYPEATANMWQMGLFKKGKYVGGSTTEFIDELPRALQVVLKNITATKGPPKVSISCRRES